MKKFILNCTAFLLLLIPVTHVKPLYLLWSNKYKHTVAGSAIYYSIFKSKQKRETKKILLGDCLGRQLFSNVTVNDTINSFACSAAVGIVGQYLLLNNYLNAGNKVDTVYLITSPFSFADNLDHIYTYHYFLKPFCNEEYFPLFTGTVKKQIHKIPYWSVCRYPLVLTSSWAPDFVSKDQINYTFISPISIEYLTRIKELSIIHNFRLIILPAPTTIDKKPIIEKMNRDEIVKNNFGQEFENYFERIIYLNDTNFLDGVHLKRPKDFTQHFYNTLMK